MFTLFCVPKPFSGHIGVIQRNALRSWLRLQPPPQILVLGDEEGAAETALELGLQHVPEVARNEHGTPLVNHVFATAENRAEHPLLAYVNADIVLMSDFGAAIAILARRSAPFLMVGRRWDLDLRQPIDFAENWESVLGQRVREEGRLHGPTGIDYFVFRRGLWPSIPPFAIGRTTWDNWLLYDARRRGAALIDATAVVTPIHQNHEYTGFVGGAGELWNSEEALRNLKLAGGYARTMSIRDANRQLTRRGTKPAVGNSFFRIVGLLRRTFFRVARGGGRRLPPP